MAELTRKRTLVFGGSALVAAGLFLWASGQSSKPASSSSGTPGPTPTPPPPSPTPPPLPCSKPGVGRLQKISQWYNWSALEVLPLVRTQAPGPSTGGTTADTLTPVGASLPYSQAKYGTAGDGRTGWYIRVDRVVNNIDLGPGDWALFAADAGISNPCA